MGNKTLKEKADSVKNIDEEVIRSNPEENGEAEGLEAQAAGGKKKSAVSRVLAILALAVLAALFIWFIICLITGSQYTMAVLFCLIIYPILLYIALWLKKVFSS